eukprot:10899934-Heterocapsa_arctica.AAC.1
MDMRSRACVRQSWLGPECRNRYGVTIHFSRPAREAAVATFAMNSWSRNGNARCPGLNWETHSTNSGPSQGRSRESSSTLSLKTCVFVGLLRSVGASSSDTTW